MRIYTACTQCNRELTFKTFAPTRVELAMRSGENIKLKCTSCNKEFTFPVDRFFAKPSVLPLIVSLVVLFLGSIATFYFHFYYLKELSTNYIIYAISGLLLVPVTIYSYINKNESDRVKRFNNYKLKY